ncbi:tape measure protein [Parasalinivibrio latis]|uniref:tape measure protein n=1 Tax=Parasalinivibrio latis TaxID=2952610 RepID=UPI0030E56D82
MADLAVSVVLKAVDRLTAPIRKIHRVTERLSDLFQSAGKAVQSFSERQRALRGQLATSNRLLARQKRVIESYARLRSQVGSLTNQLRHAAREAAMLGAKLTVVAGIGLFGFKSQFVDTAAQFETFQTILETTEGSSEKARQAMQWVSDFATKTPYELAEVNEAFVKLRAYGLDPTDGLLKTLGDTSSAMGKDLTQAVEAIADAVTGENERLKEFGIKGSTTGETITYEFTDKAGRQQFLSVDKNDRQAIRQALVGIFNDKYDGAMDRLSRTWGGMLSNLADQWTRFAGMVMSSGVFALMKSRLAEVLATINALADSGKLQTYADALATQLVRVIEGLWVFGQTFVSASRKVIHVASQIADMLGGWRPLLIGLSALMAGRFVLSLALSAKAMAVFGYQAALLTKGGVMYLATKLGVLIRAGSLLRWVFAVTPVGLLVTAITVAVGVIYKYWAQIRAFGEGVVAGLQTGIEPVKAMLSPLAPMLSVIGEAVSWAVKKLGGLFMPVSATTAELGKAAAAGKQFGEWLASGLQLALTPLSLYIEGITWVKNNLGAVTEAATSLGRGIGDVLGKAGESVSVAMDWAFGSDSKAPSPVAPTPPMQLNSTIHVTQQPGEDGEALGRRIVQEQMRIQAKRESVRQRGALFDYQEQALP